MNDLKKNLFYNVGYQILVIIIPLITAPYISRVLGVDGIGTYSYVYSIAYYFCLFSMLGISNHGNRSIALSKHDKNEMSTKFWNLYIIQFFCSVLSLFVYLFFVFFLFNGNKIIALIDIFFLLSYMFDISWLYFGLEKFKITVLRNAFFKILTLVCIFLFVKDISHLWIYTLIMGAGTFLSQLCLWFPLKKYIFLKKIDFSIIKNNIKPILVLFIPVLSYSIYKVMDKIMLGSMTTVFEVGIYENAEKIIGIPISIITALGTVMMPRISTLISENKILDVNKYLNNSFKYFTILAGAMIFGLISISNTFVPIYFGIDFQNSANTIIILSISILFLSWANIIRTQYLIPNKIDHPYIISTIVGAIVNLVINYILISKYGANGAAIGTVFAEFSVFFVQFLYTRKNINFLKNISNLVIIIPVGILMVIYTNFVVSCIGVNVYSLFLQIFGAGLIYLLCILIYCVFIKDEFVINFINKLKRK